MLDDLYRHPSWVERPRCSWLRDPIDRFLFDLATQRLHRNTLRHYARRLLAFAEFTARQGVNELSQLPEWLDAFVTRTPTRRIDRQKLCAVSRFFRYLRQHQLIPVINRPPPSPADTVVESYLRFLDEQRGLCRGTLEARRQLCQTLVTHLTQEGISDFRATRLENIHRFLAGQAQRYNRPTLRLRCSMLRDFLGFLYNRGAVAVDLRAAVMSPRVYRQEQCPRFLTRTEIESLLAAIDRNTTIGKRDFAMILLLANYGLRGIEATRLRLDDIDWRNRVLHVPQRKAGNSNTYPLSVSVGEAIVAYLQQARPTSPHRQIFLALLAPFKPLTCSSVAFRVKRYLEVAGIRIPRAGAHALRYSCAQRLFEQGLPLKSIGDYLGHRYPGTTQRYTMIDLDRLRAVASGGEELL